MILGTSSEVRYSCRSMAMVDLRAVWPGFKQFLEDLGFGGIPLVFDEVTELGSSGKHYMYEKNWAPFYPGIAALKGSSWVERVFGGGPRSSGSPRTEIKYPLLHTNILPQVIREIDSSLDVSHKTETYPILLATHLDLPSPNDTLQQTSDECFPAALPQFKPEAFHQATPYYRVTMCPKGSCVPSLENTVLLAIVHVKFDHAHYRR